MTCRGAQNRLGAYADGELTGAEMLALRAHVDRCEACATELASVRDLKRTVGALSDVEPPPGFDSRLREKVFAQTALQPRRTLRLAFGLAAVAAASAAVLLSTLQATDPVDESSPASLDRRTNEVARDQAALHGADPFSGGTGVLTVNYVR